MMLYMHPEVVDMTKARDDYHPGTGGLTRDSATALREGKTWSRSGTTATQHWPPAPRGRAVVEAQVKGMIGEVEKLREAAVP